MSDRPDVGAVGAVPVPPAGRDRRSESPLQSGSPAVATAGLPGTTPSDPAAAEVTHPSWCDRQACTARPAPSLEEYRGGGAYGKHVSAEVGTGAAVMRLTQQVAPWQTATYLKVHDDFAFMGIGLDELRRYLGQLGAAPSGPLTEEELAAGREHAERLWLPPAWTADPAGRYLASAVEELVTAERVDPLRLVDQLRRAFATYAVLASREVGR